MTPGAMVVEKTSSLLTAGFNESWAMALDIKEQVGLDYFLMLHSDVVPQDPSWLEILTGEAEKYQAKVISAVIPIKSPHGLTSTALETDNPWQPQRLTMTEVMARPETFTEPDLLVNSGMMLVDMRDPWVDDMYFTIHDRIVKRDGRRRADVQSEDWNFSRMARQAGVQLWATRKIPIQHYGVAFYTNTHAWGTVKTDERDTPLIVSPK